MIDILARRSIGILHTGKALVPVTSVADTVPAFRSGVPQLNASAEVTGTGCEAAALIAGWARRRSAGMWRTGSRAAADRRRRRPSGRPRRPCGRRWPVRRCGPPVVTVAANSAAPWASSGALLALTDAEQGAAVWDTR